MARLYLTFKDNELTATIDGIATTDTIGLECVADFLGWDGFSKTIVFYQNPRKPYRVVVNADETLFEVPHEVLLSDAPLTIGAFGVNAEGKRKTSTVVGVNITKGMFDEKAVESIKPTPSEYEQMLAFMNAYMEAEKLVDNVADAVQKATEDAREEIDSATAAAIELAKEAVDEKSAEEQREVEAVGETIIKRAEDAAEAAEISSVAAANSVGRISSVEKRLSNIEQSITPSPFVVDDSVVYAKAVPVNALPFAEINEIGGASRACTNLFNLSSAEFQSINYATASVVGDTLTVTGQAVGVDCYHLRAGVRYTLKVTSTRTGERGGGICVMQADSAGNTIGGTYEYMNVLSSSISFTVFDNTYRVRLIFYGSNVVADRTNSATFTNIMLNEGNTALPYEPYFDGLISAPVTEVKSVGDNEVASLIIPDAVRNLKGYGEGNPNNPAECNKIDFERKTYHHVGDIVDGAWVPLASPEVIDISEILPLDNYIEVFEGGAVFMESESGLDVPNTITFSLPFEIGGGGGGGGGTGENGATFIPSVSKEGIISWQNDQGLPNPTPVNIKGEKGDKGDRGLQGERGLQGVQGKQGERGADGAKGEKGDRGEQGIQGVQGKQGEKGADGTPATHRWSGTTLYMTSASGTSSANLKGDKGDDGANGKDGKDGVDGKDGYTPVKGVDYYTPADKAEMVQAVLNALPDGDEVSY